jgi:CRP-like cAMP-binding protein
MDGKSTLVQAILEESEKSLQEALQVIRLEDGEVLFHRDEPGDAFYILDEGHIHIFTHDEAGTEVILNTLQPGETLGELALLDDQPRSASARALGACRLRRLQRSDFLRMLSNSPALTQAVVQLLSERARHMTNYIERLAHWSRLVAAGRYNQAMAGIQDAGAASDRALTAVAEAVEHMVQAVKEREEKLRREVAQLRIEIDEEKRKQQVSEITETDYFQSLAERAREIRGRSEE